VFTPTLNFIGVDSFTYIAGNGIMSDTGTVVITVTGNSAPIANDDNFVAPLNSPITIPAPGVLSNDSDPNGDALTASLLTAPAGDLVFNSDGSFVYTATVMGNDSFTYIASDGSLTDTATVNIGVIDLVINEIMKDPSAVADGSGEWFEIYNNGAGGVDLLGWLISDDGSDSHTIASSIFVAPGAYVVLCNNAITTTNGGVTCDYQYSGITLSNSDDELVLSMSGAEIDRAAYDNGIIWPDPAGASMCLMNVTLDNNDGNNWATSYQSYGLGDLGTPGGPNTNCGVVIAASDSYSTTEDVMLSVAAPGVLGNDINGLSASLTVSPTNGIVTLNADGSFDYTPNLNFNGVDSFTYTASNGKTTDTATVTITIPFIQPGSLDVTFDSDGKVTTANGERDIAYDAALQTDGKIVAAGCTAPSGGDCKIGGDVAVARYNTDGSLDTTFDTDGKLTTTVGVGPNTLAYDAAIQTDGKIVVVGTASGDFALVRYLP
jgi:uncharacterized delta-60 repeat protein